MQLVCSAPVLRRPLPDDAEPLVIGRAEDAGLRLADPAVSRHHARLSVSGGRCLVEDLGSRGGTFLGGVRLSGPVPAGPGDEIRLGGTVFRLEADPSAASPGPVAASAAGGDDEPPDPREEALKARFADAALLCTPANMALQKRFRDRIVERMERSARKGDKVLARWEDPTYRPRLEAALDETLREHRHEIPADVPAEAFRAALRDEIAEYGPISPLLRADDVSEIMVNGPGRVFAEIGGLLFETGVRFFDDAHLLNHIKNIAASVGRRVDDASPMVDARLPDGSRVNAVIPPLALDGPSLTIRKFPSKKLSADDLVSFGSLSPGMAAFLREAVLARKNVVVSGGTGSGKTTLLNVLSQFIPRGERVVTIEDSAELKLSHRNVVRLEARPPNVEGTGRVTIRDLVVNALRMRPDRIVVGECRGAEALDMLQAMNTGHDGSLTTLHANTPRDALARLENMVMMAGFELPSQAIREQIASAVGIIVQQNRLPDGSRKIVSIEEVGAPEGSTITLSPVFRFETSGLSPEGKVLGRHVPTGNIPQFIHDRNAAGTLRMDMAAFVETA